MREKNEYGQYFTPLDIAESMVQLILSPRNSRILEPSCGEGIFLDVLKANGYTNIQGIEVDTRLSNLGNHKVAHSSFLTWDEQSKFDVIIGNPPYIRWKDLDETFKQEMKSLPNWNKLFNSLTDYLVPFIIESIDRLESNGELIFITPSFWMQTMHSEKMRNWMLTQGSITHLIDFEEATVFPGVATSIVIFRFEKGKKLSTLQYYKYNGKKKVKPGKLELENPEQFIQNMIPVFESGKHWTLATSQVQKELQVLESACRSISGQPDMFSPTKHSVLGEIVDIANGMVSGLDKAFKIPNDQISGLTQLERDSTLEVLKAQNLLRGSSNEITLYINIPQGLSESQVIKEYPNFYNLLSEHKEELLSRYSYGITLPYWEWAFKRSEKFFMNGVQKGVVPCKERLTSRSNVRFSLIPFGVVATQDVTAFAPKQGIRESIAYIVAYLTLPEVSQWIRFRGLMKGGVAEFSERPLSLVPFRRINWNDDKEIQFHNKIAKEFLDLTNSNQLNETNLGHLHEKLRSFIY